MREGREGGGRAKVVGGAAGAVPGPGQPPPGAPELTVGEVAARAGLAVSAVRFYESRGLIRARRTPGGQRRYPRAVLRRLAVVQAAQRVGFPLGEISDMLRDLADDHPVGPEDWRRLADGWRPRLDERIRTLERLRDQLDSCIGCGCLSMSACALANPADRAGASGPGPRYWSEAAGSRLRRPQPGTP